MKNRAIPNPRIIFSPWFSWKIRGVFAEQDLPGIYCLAHFQAPPSGNADPLSKEVLYIGETCNNSLLGRWWQFDCSAFQGKFGHSAGNTYREEVRGKGKHLYVAALAVDNFEDHPALGPMFIRYAERKLIWEYCKKWGKPPLCNRK